MKIQKLVSRTLLLSCLFSIALFSGFVNNKPNPDTDAKEKKSSNEHIMKKKQLRHVVIFKFKESASADDIAKVETSFKALQGKIPQIKDYEWGINNSPESLNKGFTHCFFLTFDSEEDRAIYLPHPDHKAFAGALGPVIEDVLVVDYWTE